MLRQGDEAQGSKAASVFRLTADLILLGRVLAGGAPQEAEAVAISRGRVLAMGTKGEVWPLRGPRTTVLGGEGRALVPGFIDAHLHFLALARRSTETDCSDCRSIREILSRLETAGRERPAGCWIRAFGYDEFFLDEKRPPSLAELDAALPRHPLRLLHRTGHLAVLNGAALAALDLSSGSTSRLVEKDDAGRPTEVVREPADLLRGRIPTPDAREMTSLCAATSEKLLSAGITGFHDPTPGQGFEEVSRLRAFIEEGVIQQRVRVYGSMDCFPRAEHHHPEPVGELDAPVKRFRQCGIKVVVTEESDPEEIGRQVAEADRAGAQVAIHAVEGGPLAVAVDVLRKLGRERVRSRLHRIEHATLCPPPLADEIAWLGATVVTHPDFLRRFGEKYRAEVLEEQWDWLYPLRSFLDRGIPLAFGSDAPIDAPSPLAAIRSSAERRTEAGSWLGRSQAITRREALSLQTLGSARAAGDERNLGRINVGAHADVVLLSGDPTAVPAEVEATVLDGRVAWAA